MLNLKKISFSLATVALTATAGTLATTTAQAAIVGGQISGTWQYDFDGEDGFNVGDLFTADYTYDSDSVTTIDYSDPTYYSRYLVRLVSLLSLAINSGPVSQAFDFSAGGYSYLEWLDFRGNPDIYGQYSYKGYSLNASDNSTVQNSFYASRYLGQNSDGSPLSNFFAQAHSYDSNTGNYPTGAYTYGEITFSDPFLPTPVPTPAMLPGLIGLGVSALRRRKQLEAVAVSD